MSRKLGLKMLDLSCIITVSMMVGVKSNGYGGSLGEPPPPDLKFAGPAIIGTLMLEEGTEESTIKITFMGRCKSNSDVVKVIDNVPFLLSETQTKKDLVGFFIPPGLGTEECGNGWLFIQAVSQFTKDEETGKVTAQVVILNLI